MFKTTKSTLIRALAGASVLAAASAMPASAGVGCDASLTKAREIATAAINGDGKDAGETVSAMHAKYENDAKARLKAYSAAIDTEAANFEKVEAAVQESIDCFGAAEAKLASMPADKRAKKMAAIRQGNEEAGTLLNTAMAAISKRVSTFDQALLVETNAEGVNLATINRLAYLGRVGDEAADAAPTAAELNDTQPAAGSMFLTLASLAALSEADPMAVEVGIATGSEASSQAAEAEAGEWTVSTSDMQEMKAADMLDELQAAGRSGQKLLSLYDRTRATIAAQQALAGKLGE